MGRKAAREPWARWEWAWGQLCWQLGHAGLPHWPRAAAAGAHLGKGGREQCDWQCWRPGRLSVAKILFLEVEVARAWPGAWECWCEKQEGGRAISTSQGSAC